MVRGVTIKVRGGMDMVTVVKVKGQQSMAKGQLLPGLALLMNVEGEYSVGWGLRSGSRLEGIKTTGQSKGQLLPGLSVECEYSVGCPDGG